MRRLTITDVARAAGISKGSASCALNGQPGVSEQTRQRVIAIARDMGWRASSAAKALSDSRAHAVGFVLARPPQTLGAEPFFMQMISGVEAVLAKRSVALVLQMVDGVSAELAAYDRWWAERRVDGVLVSDVRVHDPRIAHVQKLKMPAAVFGLPRARDGLSAVRFDETVMVKDIVGHLAGLGHRRIARIAGRKEFLHTATRGRALKTECERLGLTETGTIFTDFSSEQGAAATRELLADRPTALVYDNDIMALAGLSVARERNLSVPADISIVAIGNSPIYDLIEPSLTATERDVVGFGARGAEVLLDLLDGNPAQTVWTPAAELIQRDSTGVPRVSGRRIAHRSPPR